MPGFFDSQGNYVVTAFPLLFDDLPIFVDASSGDIVGQEGIVPGPDVVQLPSFVDVRLLFTPGDDTFSWINLSLDQFWNSLPLNFGAGNDMLHVDIDSTLFENDSAFTLTFTNLENLVVIEQYHSSWASDAHSIANERYSNQDVSFERPATLSINHSRYSTSLNVTLQQAGLSEHNGNVWHIEEVGGPYRGDFIHFSSIDIIGGGASDFIQGGVGDDRLNGGGGADTLLGGEGNDVYVVDNAGDGVTEDPDQGIDTVQSSITYGLRANVENLTLIGAVNIRGSGNAADNVIIGNSGNNMLEGAAGADLINGGAGVDIATYTISTAGVNVSLAAGSAHGGDAEGDILINIEGLTGSNFGDTLEGDGGNNVLLGAAGIDTVSYAHASAGVTVNLALITAQDTIGAGIDTLSSIENLVGSDHDDVLIGSSIANTISGGAGNDILNGATGADTLIGGVGDDTYVVDHPLDVVTENAGEGTDTVQASVSHTLSADVENLTLTGASNINGIGNVAANVITGNGGNNTLAGLVGADTLDGGAGNDSIDGGIGADILTGGVGNDSFVLRLGEADGDTVTDFTGAGPTVGDRIELHGYGAGSIEQVGSTDYYLITPDEAHGGIAAAETIHIANVFTFDTSPGSNDFLFY